MKETKKKEGGLLEAMSNSGKTSRTGKWLDERLSEIEKERTDTETGIQRLERERKVLLESSPDPRNVKATLEYVFKNFRRADPGVQRNFMRQVFEKVVVVNKHQAKAYWRFSEMKKPTSFSAPCDAGGSGFSLDQKWGIIRELNDFNSLSMTLVLYFDPVKPQVKLGLCGIIFEVLYSS